MVFLKLVHTEYQINHKKQLFWVIALINTFYSPIDSQENLFEVINLLSL